MFHYFPVRLFEVNIRSYSKMFITAFILLFVILSISCGKSISVSDDSGDGKKSEEISEVGQALSGLEALPPTDGVEAEIFSLLKDELARQLNSNYILEKNQRVVSIPPRGDANQVDDLTITETDGTTITLSWSYKNRGDYNQDGTVDIQDISKLAQHFLHVSSATGGEETDPEDIVIDGNADGRVNIGDVSTLARNFFTNCAGYKILGTDIDGLSFTDIDFVPFSEATGKENGWAKFSFTFEVGNFVRFKVAAVDRQGALGAESTTIASLNPEPPSIISVSPQSGTSAQVTTFSATFFGTEPISFEWNFGGGADPNTSPERSPSVTLMTPGSYTGSLTLTNELGSDTMEFTYDVIEARVAPSIVSINASGGVIGGAGSFSAEVTGSLPISYSWNFGGGAMPNVSSDPAPIVTMGNPGTYNGSLTVTNDVGSDTKTFIYQVVGITPSIQSINFSGGRAGAQVAFSVTVTGTSPLTYQWDFGGGATPNSFTTESGVVTLGSVGSYTGSVTVSNDWGSDTETFNFTVTDNPEPTVHDVIIQGFAFIPNDITVRLGDTVRWTNKDSVRHTATCFVPDGPVSFDTLEFGKNESRSVTFTVPGVYNYHCEIHPFMTARITVAE